MLTNVHQPDTLSDLKRHRAELRLYDLGIDAHEIPSWFQYWEHYSESFRSDIGEWGFVKSFEQNEHQHQKDFRGIVWNLDAQEISFTLLYHRPFNQPATDQIESLAKIMTSIFKVPVDDLKFDWRQRDDSYDVIPIESYACATKIREIIPLIKRVKQAGHNMLEFCNTAKLAANK